eukprot:gene14684-14809_t
MIRMQAIILVVTLQMVTVMALLPAILKNEDFGYGVVSNPTDQMPGNWLQLGKENGAKANGGIFTPRQAQLLKSKAEDGGSSVSPLEGILRVIEGAGIPAAIIRLPQPFRYLLAQFVSKTRAKKAIGIYQKMGGKSPLLENTVAQAKALEDSLRDQKSDYKAFISMRYWHPFTEETVKEVKNYNPDELILLPLYPHYSTTTTESSFKEWYRVAKEIKVPVREIESYPLDESFIKAHVETLTPIYKQAAKHGTPRILFSAHSLPQKIVDEGDPYQKQTEQTAEAIIAKLEGQIDYVVCYQSRVGPLKWLQPTTEAEIKRAASNRIPVVVVPISFVSEHSETTIHALLQGVERAFNPPASPSELEGDGEDFPKMAEAVEVMHGRGDSAALFEEEPVTPDTSVAIFGNFFQEFILEGALDGWLSYLKGTIETKESDEEDRNAYAGFLDSAADFHAKIVSFLCLYPINLQTILCLIKQCHALGHLYVGDMLCHQSVDHLDHIRQIHGLEGVDDRFMGLGFNPN